MRKTLIIAIVAASVALSASAVHADKLVIFKNGKAMKIRNVTEDGAWLRLEFDDTNFMAVQRSRIEAVIEAAAGSADAPGSVNQLVEGSRGAANIPDSGGGAVDFGGTARPAGRLNNRRGVPAGQEGSPAGIAAGREAIRDALEEEQKLLQNPAGRRGNIPGQQALPPGFQSLNNRLNQQLNEARTPFSSRRGRLGKQKPQQQEQQPPDGDDDE